MAKTFNGKKFSHGFSVGKTRAKCLLCGSDMINFHGVLRCTEMRAGKKKGASQHRVIKHGSMRTIAKRVAQRELQT